jgi:hypothetical protein
MASVGKETLQGGSDGGEGGLCGYMGAKDTFRRVQGYELHKVYALT